MAPRASNMALVGTSGMIRRTSQVVPSTIWTTLMPLEQDWSEAWELLPTEGVMLWDTVIDLTNEDSSSDDEEL